MNPTLLACVSLFFLRVIGQVEVLLVAPEWLPSISSWYSGLLPYPVLLPLQVALLMIMIALTVGSYRVGFSRVWITFGLVYFGVMALRLAVCIFSYGADFYEHGAIPIAFHWVLALFAITYARKSMGELPSSGGSVDDSRSRSAEVPFPPDLTATGIRIL